METKLKEAGLQVRGQVRTFEEIEVIYTGYLDIIGSRGWKDYQSRLLTMRTQIQQELLIGTLDKWGNSHDNEKRAVLTYLDRALEFLPALVRQYEDLKKRKNEMLRKANEKGDLHGGEFASSTRVDF